MANRIWSVSDFVDLDEVVEKADVFVLSLASSNRAQDGDKGEQILVDCFKFSMEERTR